MMPARGLAAVLFVLLLTASCSGLHAGALKAEPGDVVLVRYSVSTPDGQLVASTFEGAADVPVLARLAGEGSAGWTGPEPVIAGEGGPLPEVGRQILGLAPGDRKSFPLAPLEEFGRRDPADVREFPARIESPLELNLAISDYVARYDHFPAKGDSFAFNKYLSATIAEVGETGIRVELLPSGQVFEEPFGTVTLEKGPDSIVSRLAAKVGAEFREEGRAGVIIAAGAENFTVDFNHPLAGKTLAVDLSVQDVIRRSSVPQGEPDWIRDEAKALKRAARSGKPLVLVLHSEGCGNCELFFGTTIPDPTVRALRDRFEWAAVEPKKVPGEERRHRVRLYPTILLMTPDGRETARADGYLDAQAFWRLVMGDGAAQGSGR
jgi:FKBP-type peptidyl-prolyl cis-trans isomerase 2